MLSTELPNLKISSFRCSSLHKKCLRLLCRGSQDYMVFLGEAEVKRERKRRVGKRKENRQIKANYQSTSPTSR